MAAFNCENIIKQHLGRNTLTEQEILDLADQARQLVKKEMAGRTIADLNAAVQQLMQNWQTSQQAVLAAKRRNTWLNAKKAMDNIEFAMGWDGKEMDALSALLTGSRYTREGARRSVDNIAGSLRDKYFGAIDNALRKLGDEHIKFFQNGKIDEHLANAFFYLNHPAAYQGPKIAMEMAQAIAPIREHLRQRANRAGAYIGELDGGFREGARLELVFDGPLPVTLLAIVVSMDVANTAGGQQRNQIYSAY